MSITTGSGYWGTLEAVNVKVPVRMHRAVGGFSQSQASGGCRGTFGIIWGLVGGHPPTSPKLSWVLFTDSGGWGVLGQFRGKLGDT